MSDFDIRLSIVNLYFDSLDKIVNNLSQPIDNLHDVEEILRYLSFCKNEYDIVSKGNIYNEFEYLEHHNAINSLNIFKERFNKINNKFRYYYGKEGINKDFQIHNIGLKRLIFEINMKLVGLNNYFNSNTLINNIDLENILDYSNTGANEKVIALKELGIIEFLQNNNPICQTSTNKLAEVLSLLTGEKAKTIQSYLNPIINNQTSQKNNPYNNTKTVEKTKDKLINIGISSLK